MSVWDQSFCVISWDRHFPNQERADEAWVSVLIDHAINELPSDLRPITSPAYYAKKVLDEYQAHTQIYPTG